MDQQEKRQRSKTSIQQRRDALEEATRVAREVTEEERRRREAKTERLREARLKAERTEG